MKRDIAYYRDKYENGFIHYLKRVNYWETLEHSFDSLSGAAVNFISGLLGVLVGIPVFLLRATILWPFARIFEYFDNKKALAELFERDEARAARRDAATPPEAKS